MVGRVGFEPRWVHILARETPIVLSRTVDRHPYPLSEECWVLRHVMEPLRKRQIEALRKASGISTFYLFLDMSDFILNLATKGGRKDEMEKLARVVYGATRKL